MFRRPRLGMKIQTIERILLIVEKRPQRRIVIVEVKGTNCFSTLTVLRRRVTQLFRVIMMDNRRTTTGSSGMPEKVFWLKAASSPPVVLVSVVA